MNIPDLASYDWIVLNTSSGKDSQTTMRYAVRRCIEARVHPKRLVAVHSDLGEMEWPGCPDLAGKQTEHYGLRFEVVKRKGCDLLARVLERRMWPDPKRRWCTSDFKRGPVHTLLTRLADEWHGGPHSGPGARYGGRPCRILNCMGMRAQESPARRKMEPFGLDHQSRRRTVDQWLPIHQWPVEEVWSDIRASGVPHHQAYDYGMPRLSCSFCIYAPPAALKLAGRCRPELLDQYVQVEREINHTFKLKLSLAEIQEAIQTEDETEAVEDWRM